MDNSINPATATETAAAAPDASGTAAAAAESPQGSGGSRSERRLFTAAQARAMFGVGPQAWAQWQARGRVRGVLRGKHRLYPQEELERLREEIRLSTEPHPDPQRPGVWRVPVTSEKHPGMFALVDEDAVPLVQGKRWNWAAGAPSRPYNGSVVLSTASSIKPVLGRVVLGIDDPEQLVAHVNGDRLDCRRENLVVRTRSESARLRKPSPETLARLAPYPDPDRPGVWRVPLKSHLAERREVLIDEADLPVVQGRNWNWAGRSDDDAGRMDGVVVLAKKGEQRPLHRIIAKVTDPRTRVWFVNGDALDCRRANLRVLTMAETVQATRKASNRAGKACSSSFKGVCWDGPRGKWFAQLRSGRVYSHIGRFDTEVEAARAYDAAARVRFGAHAYLNLPDEASSEQALADARAALENDVKRTRLQRRRQRDIERGLRGAATAAAAEGQGVARDGEAVMISAETARQLFDVPPTVWQRWQRFGWVPATGIDERAMVPLAGIERLLQRCGIVALPYPDPQRAGVYRVPLSGETAEGREALIDADAVARVQTRRWRFAQKSDVGRGGEVQTMIPSENIRLHYVVMGITPNDQEFHIGHRNDDPLDCRRSNLVVRTLADTHANQRKQATWCGRPCTSRFKGVWWEKRRHYWVATIKKDGVQRRLGTYHDEIAAAQAYDEAARELFGEHARLNFPDGVEAWLMNPANQNQDETRDAA